MRRDQTNEVTPRHSKASTVVPGAESSLCSERRTRAPDMDQMDDEVAGVSESLLI
jgi:hypothetical protein